MSIRVVIFTDAKGWHEARLTEAFRAVGAESSLVSLANCSFSADSKFGCLTIPGFEDALPDAAFVRGISAGTFEQVTLRLDFLHALTDLSVKVVNSARVIEKTVDKAMTSHLLKRRQVETVPAWTFESRQLALELIRSKTSQNRQLVLKAAVWFPGSRFDAHKFRIRPPRSGCSKRCLLFARVHSFARRRLARLANHGSWWKCRLCDGASLRVMDYQSCAGSAVLPCSIGSRSAGIGAAGSTRCRSGLCRSRHYSLRVRWLVGSRNKRRAGMARIAGSVRNRYSEIIHYTYRCIVQNHIIAWLSQVK